MMKPAVDPEQENRWKLAEQKRAEVEKELQSLREALAKKTADPPAPKRRSSPKIATIYRGIQNVQRIRLDKPAITELELVEESSAASPPDSQAPAGSSSTQVAAADDRSVP